MALKQAFKKQNNRLSRLLGHPIGKADFLRIIGPVREQALKKSTIQAAFRERGIWPPNGPGAQAIIKKLEDRQPPVPDIEVPEYAYTGEAGLRPACTHTPACMYTPTPACTHTPSPALSSSKGSSIDPSPPKSIQALQKNHAKLAKIADTITPKQQRNKQRLFHHNAVIQEHSAIANSLIQQMQEAGGPPLQIASFSKCRMPAGLHYSAKLSARCCKKSISASQLHKMLPILTAQLLRERPKMPKSQKKKKNA
jgi:hypothetical protein